MSESTATSSTSYECTKCRAQSSDSYECPKPKCDGLMKALR